ncbi:SIMPL domain-containing protein [Aestuariibacter halophilus]|uniref:SIMPL domain-containing protein n=1 Tax=Fluctibacter halophilus TaxID=226011 RepID=A0ABS8G6U1_9ALTE|nr:SIMPL domain-containing protein [Aestuariibacter halophilus]MCC2616128.1 SIMPL domain-containing protein [Aestuariibacter halophilus]
MKNNRNAMAWSGLMVAIGLSVAGYFVSQTLYKSKIAVNVAEVKGLAERTVRATQAIWKLDFTVSADATTPLEGLYREAEARQQAIRDYLLQAGFTSSDITIGVIDYAVREYRNNNQVLVERQHSLTGSLEVNSADVGRVADVRAGVNSLIAKGIPLNNHAPRYLFTALNAIKPDMLREATQNARIAANEFASMADVKVGGIQHARQGNFSIRDTGEQYGDDRKIEKDVRVVTSITFYMTE